MRDASPLSQPSPRPCRRRVLTSVPLATASIGLLSACSTAGATTGVGRVLSISLNQTESHPSYRALSLFAELLAESTDNRWGARVYPNETLGAQQEVVQLVSDGSVDLAVISSPQMENLSLRFRVMNLPGAFESIEHQSDVLTDPTVIGDLFSSLEESKRLTVLGGFTQGARHLYTRTGPIVVPDDLAGMKIRVQESEVFLALIRAMGGSPTPMAYGEVYTALQAGVLDGAENNEVSYMTQRHNEIAPHFSRTRHLVGLDYVVANSDRIASMSGQDQEAFRNSFLRAQDEFVRLWTEETEQSITKMLDAGVQITDPDREAFDERIDAVAREFLTTAEDEALYERIRSLSTEEARS